MKKKVFILFLVSIFALSFYVFAEKTEKKECKIKYGQVTLEQMLAGSPDWKDMAEKYEPNPEDIDFLANIRVPVTIELYYAHWCKDSVNNVPKFLRIMELVNESGVYKVDYWSLPKRKKGEKREPVNGRKIKAIPTFVVFLEGREIGEIVENPEVSMEGDLTAIIKKAQTAE